MTGRDLIRMGYRPGPHFGECLDTLLDAVLADPELNVSSVLEARAAAWMEARDD